MKLLATDYDCTFYVNDKDIKKNLEIADVFMRENIFVIATGRSYLDYNKVKEKYNLKTNYIIINHGATILKNNKIIYNKTINNEIKNEILIDLELEKAVNIFACNGLKSILDLNNDNLTKIHVRYECPEEAKRIHDVITAKYGDYVSVFIVCGYKALEIVSNEANKSKAISVVAKLENIPTTNIYTIGDGYSDIQMINDFNGFRMKECVEELRKLDVKEYESVSNLIIDILNKRR